MIVAVINFFLLVHLPQAQCPKDYDMLNLLAPFIPLLSITFLFFACGDETLAPEYLEPMVRVRDMSIASPVYTQAGQEAGSDGIAGNPMLADMMNGMAGSESFAGSMSNQGGGEVMGGSIAEAGSSMPAGMEAGAMPSAELSCLGILECLGSCNENAMCIETCVNNGSVEGITALNELVGCDQSQNCASEVNCLNQRCAAELIRCETGMMPNMGGAEMAGIEMAGIEVGGTEMAGTEVGGTEMAGTEVGGTEMGGTTPPVGPLSCIETLDCVETCADDDQNCTEGCVNAASSSAMIALASLVVCGEDNLCMDSTCITNFCSTELTDCALDGQMMASDCLFDLECPISLPVCVDGACAECEYSSDCDLGYTCEQNSCVEMNRDCQADFYEPNNEQNTATSALLTSLISSEESLSLCVLDRDYYEVEVCPNGTVTSQVRFDSLQADIDTQFIFPNASTFEQIANGFSGVEQMSHTNLSASPQIILLYVYPYDPVSSVNYTLELEFECP